MKNHYFLLCTVLLLHYNIAKTQNFPIFSYSNTPPQITQNDAVLTDAWASGLHAPQFSHIDLDNNGTQDLFVFDRLSNAVLTFIATPNGYRYAQQYTRMFPRALHDWAILCDMDNDDLPELLTYGVAGIRYFQAHRNFDNSITYIPKTQQLSFQGIGGIPLNVPATPVDIPFFADIDQDGDVDILQFDFIGKYVELYQNQSQELTQTPTDSLYFLLSDQCWGKFSEEGGNNTIILNDDCNGNADPIIPLTSPTSRHTGSAILLYDNDADSDQDMLIGDVSHRNLVQLTNNNGIMTAPIYDFPAYDTPTNIHLFPAPYSIDIDNDSVLDLVVSPNEKRAQTTQQIWAYKNIGTSNAPIFSLQTRNFLTEQMIDVGLQSRPIFADYDNDSLPDLWISNAGTLDTTLTIPQYKRGTISLYRNIGTSTNPAFELVTNNYQHIDTLQWQSLAISVGDLDNDSDLDLIVGDELGKIHFFRNQAPPNEAINWVLDTPNLLTVNDGSAIVPCLFDVDNDNRLDLIVGEKAGKLRYYINESTTNTPQWTLEKDYWGQVDVRTLGTPFGYSAPYIHVFGNDTILFVASESGKVFAYNHLQQEIFETLNDSLFNANHAKRGSLRIVSPQNGLYFMVIGNQRGGLSWYIANPNGVGNDAPTSFSSMPHIYPNPTTTSSVYIEGLSVGKQYQIILCNSIGQTIYYTTTGNKKNTITLPSTTEQWWITVFDNTGQRIYSNLIIQHK